MYSIIGIAVELLEKEITPKLSVKVHQSWREFARLYHDIRESYDVAGRAALLRLADEFLVALGAPLTRHPHGAPVPPARGE